MSKKILFIQVRLDAEAREQEYECLLRNGGVTSVEVEQHNLVAGPIDLNRCEEWVGIVIGGSGDFSGHDEYPHRASLEVLIRQCEEMHWPALGICFGSQVVAEALGGRSVEDRTKAEIGTCLLRLLPAAANDLFFVGCSSEFMANEGHHSVIQKLPDGAVLLAESDRCPVQAFRSAGGIYGVQFHPELDREGMLWRLRHYNDQYGEDANPEIKLEDTSESARLLQAWLKGIWAGK